MAEQGTLLLREIFASEIFANDSISEAMERHAAAVRQKLSVIIVRHITMTPVYILCECVT